MIRVYSALCRRYRPYIVPTSVLAAQHRPYVAPIRPYFAPIGAHESWQGTPTCAKLAQPSALT